MAAPQLRLEVSLNLAGFRNEVRKLTQIAQSEFNPLLKVDVDTRDYRAQLKALERIKPVIKIEDSQLDAARARIGTLNKSLATLRRATATPIEIKLKYTEIGKPPSTAAGQVGRAVSGGVRGSQALEGANRSELLNIRKMMSEAGMALGKITSLSKATASELRNSIIPAFTNSGEEAVNGLAAGLKDSSSKIGKIAAKVGVEAVNGIKGALGIASPSRVFKQIGEFSVDGLELGFLNGLKDFKGKSVAEIRKIVALLKLELAKVSEGGGIGGPSMGSLRRQLVGQRAYTSPIGPLPVGSREPYAKGTRGQFGYSGYEPRMVSRPYTGGPRFPVEGMMAPRPEFGFASTGQSQPTGQAAGRSRENTTLGAMGGYNPGVRSSAMFPMGGMMGPSSPLGRITPQSSMFGGGGGGSPGGGGPGGGGGGSFGGMRFNVPQLPGSGVVREIGTEFAFAAKQVLLFGTAYKALAFLQGFPSQVGNAVGALQSFRNTLGAISPSAAEAAASSQFILDVVDKYNTPIQSARDGFTKLYASMKPTGFSGDEIRDLFLGISQAAATFGMSSDKVDRVNYAFAQMASKGQVMSEELKGQLGDVLPGAMGIFAEAAGFKGPEAITKFSKALEDGAYKGEAMKTLLTNVGLIMRQEFGPGAEGAARTFQGVINRMQNSLTLLYESFEPVAVGFLNAVVMPMTSGIKTVTDGFKAFFTGQAAQTAGGSVFAKQLEALRPAFEGIAANIKQILPLLQSFASTALSLGQALLQIAGNPFVGYLARIYLSVLPLTMALRVLNLQVLIPLIGSFLRAIPAFISFNAAMMSGVGTNRALIATMQLTGQTAGVTAGRIRLVSAALATLGSTAILAGIGLLVEKFLMMKGAIDGVRQSTQQMLGSISGMANSGAVRELKNVGQDLQKQRGTFEELRSFVSGGAIAGGKERLTEAGAKKFEEVGMGSFVKKDVFGKPYIADFLRASEIIEEKLKGLDKQSSKVQEKLPLAAKVAADLAKQAQAAQVIAPIPEAPGDGTGKPPKEQSLESYYSLQDTLAKNAADFAAAQTEEEFRHKIELLEMYYDIQETRAKYHRRSI
jgi:tape measure domain-containing protein